MCNIPCQDGKHLSLELRMSHPHWGCMDNKQGQEGGVEYSSSILHTGRGGLLFLSCAGHKVTVQAPDRAAVQRCKQQIVWSAESQASLADLECRVDEAADRAAAGKVNF